MKTHFNPNNNPRVIIIQKLYGKFINEDNNVEFNNIKDTRLMNFYAIKAIKKNDELYLNYGNNIIFEKN